MMEGITDWFMDLSNSKSVGLVIFFVTFVSIIVYVYGSKKRSKRLEEYRDIPFLEGEDDLIPSPQKGKKG